MASSESRLQEHDTSHGSSKLQVTILASVWGSSKGGLSTINTELAIQLAKFSDVEITFFLPKCSDEDRKAANRHGVSIVEAARRPGYDELDWLSFPPENLRIDVVVGHTVREELGMFKCYEHPFSIGGQKDDEVELCRMADFVVGVGPKVAKAYRKYLSVYDKDVFEFTPGIFVDFSSVQLDPGETKQYNVLVFGRGNAEDFVLKGFDIAARSVAALSDAYLVFVEAPHGNNEELFVGSGIPEKHLIVKSYRSQEAPKWLFYEVDLVLMPSRTEGFGLTGLEGMSAGLPVLVSKNSGFGEALFSVPFGSSYVIDSEDPSIWTAAIKNIWTKDRKTRLQETESLRDSYGKSYSWAKQCKDLIKKMLQLLDGHSSGVSPKTKKGTEENETAQPADLDESVSFKPGTLSQDDVLDIAHELGSLWMMLGRALYVPDAVIDQIEAYTVKVSEKCYRVLRRWQERNPSDATYQRLARALQHPILDRVDVAVKYCGLQLGKDVAVAKDYQCILTQ